jgi:uncharacterized protein YegJ (DUF2314 family)
MKYTAQIAPLLIAALAFVLPGCAHPDKGYVTDTDPEMAAAIAQAQATLPQFWQTYEQRPRGESNFVLVVRITDHDRIEHFHTTDFQQEDGSTFVAISHTPKIVTNVKRGDWIWIPASDITDWIYMRGGKYVGLRTIRPRFKYMPADQVEGFKRALLDP